MGMASVPAGVGGDAPLFPLVGAEEAGTRFSAGQKLPA